MIVYDKERKTLVIPEGIGCDCGGSTDCTSAVTAAYQEGYREGYLSGASTTDCSSAITEAYESGITEGIAEQKALLGSVVLTGNGKFYHSNGWSAVTVALPTMRTQANKTFNLSSGDTSPWTVIPDTDYDNMWQVTVEDNGYGQGKYDEGYGRGFDSGYTAGLEDCSGCTEAGGVGLESDWGGYNVYYPLGACPFSQFTVMDLGYGQAKYDSGFTDGYASGHTDGYSEGYLSGASTTDCASAITEAYNSGYTAGQATCSGSCLIQAQKTYSLDPAGDGTWTAHPDGGYDGIAEIVIKDNVGYGQSLYTSGYAAGLAACSGGCNLIADTNSLNGAWGGRTTYYPPTGYDGFSEMTIYDNGYGNSRYNDGRTAGFNSGYTSGYTDGYSSGFTDGHTSGYTDGYNEAITANCGSAITEAYESGYTAGSDATIGEVYEDLRSVAYFDTDNCVPTDMDVLEGDTIVIDFKLGSGFTASDRLVLLSNSNKGEYSSNWHTGDPCFYVEVQSGGLKLVGNDGSGSTIQWFPSGITFYANDNYHIVIKTSDGLGGNSSVYVSFMNESRGTVASDSRIGNFPHFSPETGDTFIIGGSYREDNDTYEGMFDDWYLKSLNIYRYVSGESQMTRPLAASFVYRNSALVNLVNGTEYNGINGSISGEQDVMNAN